jgi:bacterioferritin
MSGISESFDADGASSSIKEEIIKGLKEDLARECKEIIKYIVFSSNLKGVEYGNRAGQLEKHASDELEHALKVAKQIDYLGGSPTMKGKEPENSRFQRNAGNRSPCRAGNYKKLSRSD